MADFAGDILQARAAVLGDDVNTDLNCSGKYLPGKDEAYIAAHAFEALAPGFASRFSPGGVIVAGKDFGINSSREQATHVLKRMGVGAIVAKSFGRQFFRNAINNGLLVIEVDTTGIEEGDTVVIDLQAQALMVPARKLQRQFGALAPTIRAILREGGLIPFLKKYPNWELTA